MTEVNSMLLTQTAAEEKDVGELIQDAWLHSKACTLDQ